MKASVSEPKSWLREIYVEVPVEEVRQAYDKKLKKYKNEVKLPGFRPGKVPLSMVQSRFGKALKIEVAEELISASYKEACTTNQIYPITEPTFSDVTFQDESPLSYKVSVEIDPPIEVKGYKNLQIRPQVREVTQQEIDTAIEELRERMAIFNDVERPSQKNDFITLEHLDAVMDGAPVKDIKAPEYPFEIGKSSLEDLDKGLIGLSAGQESIFSVTFPNDYKDTELAGKTAQFTLRVKKVQEKQMPELDEALLKKLGDFADTEALVQAVRKDLEEQVRRRAKEIAHEEAVDELIKKNDFEVPPARIEYYIDKVLEEEKQYNKNNPPAREEVDAKYREAGIRSIKKLRIIHYIINKEKIKATQEEVDARIRSIAEQYKTPFEEVKATFRKNGTTLRIRETIQEQKVLDSLIHEIPWENPDE